MKTLLLVLALTVQAPNADGGFFSLDPSWLPDLAPTHQATQVGHGLITGLAAGVGALVAGEGGAKVGAVLLVGYYLVREWRAQLWYRDRHQAGSLTREEYRKASWDSYLDIAYPAAVAVVPLTWSQRGGMWPLWLLAIGATAYIGDATDPGGMYSGMR